MSETRHSITYAGESIPFHLSYSKRKSLEIAVYPDRSVSVKAPLEADETSVMQYVHKRARWIKRQLCYFAQFEPRTQTRRFVGGESHLYLGRKYRLKIRQCASERVLLKHGFFHINTPDDQPAHIARLLEQWYRHRAEVYFSRVLEECWQRYHFQKKAVQKPALKIRSMKTRWGSLSRKSSMTLNLELIKVPRECIEYVVVHELCHLLHHNHGKGFYNMLESILPDWVERKHKLEITCSRHT